MSGDADPSGGNTAYDDPTGYREKARQDGQRVIRTSGRFDSVIDFDRWRVTRQKPGQSPGGVRRRRPSAPEPSGLPGTADAVPSWLFRQEPLPRDFGFN
ncbi:hypothetical protein GCM10018966_013650 [Streptomyces yanii]